MNKLFSARVRSFDTQAIHETIRRALASAGLDTSSGPLAGVTETIRDALSPRGDTRQGESRDPASIIDVVARVVERGGPDAAAPRRELPAGEDGAPDAFETHRYSNHAGTRAYMLSVPSNLPDKPPMIVMLHGCTQSAADFAAGTQMNRLANEHGVLVVYPEQDAGANPSKCWNWFKPQDQLRDAGEPSLIAGIVREVAQRHGADPRRIFVAGLSAGAAMAVVLGEAYPELFAGVGAHSGLPYGSAHDVPSALAAMKGGRSGLPGLNDGRGAAWAVRKKAVQPVPTIVFHGDRDHTVQQSNGIAIVEQATEAQQAQPGAVELNRSIQRGRAPGGRGYSRTLLVDGKGRAVIESWCLEGAGHAWSGGDARGSYTDANGPDASAEMLRFFLALPRAGSA